LGLAVGEVDGWCPGGAGGCAGRCARDLPDPARLLWGCRLHWKWERRGQPARPPRHLHCSCWMTSCSATSTWHSSSTSCLAGGEEGGVQSPQWEGGQGAGPVRVRGGGGGGFLPIRGCAVGTRPKPGPGSVSLTWGLVPWAPCRERYQPMERTLGQPKRLCTLLRFVGADDARIQVGWLPPAYLLGGGGGISHLPATCAGALLTALGQSPFLHAPCPAPSRPTPPRPTRWPPAAAGSCREAGPALCRAHSRPGGPPAGPRLRWWRRHGPAARICRGGSQAPTAGRAHARGGGGGSRNILLSCMRGFAVRRPLSYCLSCPALTARSALARLCHCPAHPSANRGSWAVQSLSAGLMDASADSALGQAAADGKAGGSDSSSTSGAFGTWTPTAPAARQLPSPLSPLLS
jgi:hypothetical protein